MYSSTSFRLPDLCPAGLYAQRPRQIALPKRAGSCRQRAQTTRSQQNIADFGPKDLDLRKAPSDNIVRWVSATIDEPTRATLGASLADAADQEPLHSSSGIRNKVNL